MENLLDKVNRYKRNEIGLLDGVNYVFNEDLSINWRAMIDPKFLYVNKDNFLKRKETPPETIEGVEDKDLIIMLKGLQPLAQARGYTSVSYRPICASNEYAAVVCQITWIGNYETNMQPITYEDCAGANIYNTSELIQSYLVETATNRAFARCIRNFLKIGIVAREELPPPKKVIKTNGQMEPAAVLASLMKEKGRTFEEVRKKMVDEGNQEFASYKDWTDIPGDKAFELVNRFKVLKSR